MTRQQGLPPIEALGGDFAGVVDADQPGNMALFRLGHRRIGGRGSARPRGEGANRVRRPSSASVSSESSRPCRAMRAVYRRGRSGFCNGGGPSVNFRALRQGGPQRGLETSRTMQTQFEKPATAQVDWYVVDASGKTLGRLASQIALRLKGKHKASYSPHVDMGDHIVVLHAEKIAVTGNKLDDK